MADDSKKTSPSLSVPQAAANLDDVLASLEQQTAGVQPMAAVETPSPAAATDATHADLPGEMTPSDPVISPVVEAHPVITPVEPAVSAPKTFDIEEKHIEPSAPVSAPVVEPMTSMHSVQEPVHQADAPSIPLSPMIEQSVPPSPPSAPAQEPPKKSFLGGLFNPKFAIGAAIVAIMAIGGVAAYITSQGPTGSLDTREKATGCQIDYNGNSFTTINCSGSITTYNGPGCPTTLHPAGSENISGGTHTYNPSPPAGECQQIDHNFGGEDLKNPGTMLGAGGVCTCNNAQPTPVPKKACGDSCVSDSDCINPSGAGATVVCRAGKCENAACPAGMTQPGVNCACNAGRSCGQTCGTTIGLCTDGVSTCTYVNTNGPVCSWGWTQFYCAGTKNGYQRLSCTSGDTGGQYLVGPSGKMSGFTLAEIAASCTQIATPTPTPVVTPTPSPTPAVTAPPMACLSITRDVDAPNVGSSVRFTCGQVSGATSYEFRYKYSKTGSADVTGSISANSNVTVPFVITQAAAYKVQCRPCVGTTCTPWETW